MAQEKGSGRTVPVEEHVGTHLGVTEVVHKLMEKYKNDPRVSIKVIDNTGGVADVHYVYNALAFLKEKGYTVTERDNLLQGAKNYVEQQYKSGEISKQTRDGFLGRVDKGASSGTGRGVSERTQKGNSKPREVGARTDKQVKTNTPLREAKTEPTQTKKSDSFTSRVFERMQAEHPDVLKGDLQAEHINLKEDAR